MTYRKLLANVSSNNRRLVGDAIDPNPGPGPGPAPAAAAVRLDANTGRCTRRVSSHGHTMPAVVTVDAGVAGVAVMVVVVVVVVGVGNACGRNGDDQAAGATIGSPTDEGRGSTFADDGMALAASAKVEAEEEEGGEEEEDEEEAAVADMALVNHRVGGWAACHA